MVARVVDAAALARWIQATFPLERVRCGPVVTRPRNTLVRVEATNGAYWLRLVTGVDMPTERVEREARTIAALAAEGVRVAEPVALRAGGFSTRVEVAGVACTALLVREAPGREIGSPTAPRAESLGAAVARVHRSTAVAPQGSVALDRSYLADEPLDRVAPWLERHGFDIDALRRVVDEVDALANARVPGLWRDRCLSHGDVRFENTRYDDSGPTLFDWECVGLAPAAYDLACFWRSGMESAESAELRFGSAIFEAFVRGYRTVRPISDAAISAVPALATLRAVWVMSLPTEPGSRWGASWLEDREYFAAHVGLIQRYAGLAREWSERHDLDDVFRLVDAVSEPAHQDWDHYVAWFRFPDEETKARCLAPLGLDKAEGPTYPVVLGEIWVTAFIEGLQVVFRLEPGGSSGHASMIDAARARTAARAFQHLEILRFRVL
jgi:Ser/Thr protein kinase RdoA (MazF antagonist)